MLEFSGDGTLWDIPRNAFGWLVESIVARWFVQGMTEHRELYTFGLLEHVTPYALCACEIVLLGDFDYRVVWRLKMTIPTRRPQFS